MRAHSQNPSQPLSRLQEKVWTQEEILCTPRCNAPGRESREAVTLLHTTGPRPGVAVTTPGSHRAPWSEPGSDVGLVFALLCFSPSGSCTRGSPWPPLTVSQGCSKVTPLQAQGIISSHLLCCPAWYSRKTSHVYLQSPGAGIGSFVTWSRAGLWELNSQGQDGN